MGAYFGSLIEAKENRSWHLKSELEKNPEISLPDREGNKQPEFIPVNFFGYGGSTLFAILGDRNDKTSFFGEYDSIAEMRGTPDDISAEAQRYLNLFYSPYTSWITAEEFINFDWTKSVKSFVWVKPEFVKLFGDGNKKFPFDRNEKKDDRYIFASWSKDRIKCSYVTTYEEITGIKDDIAKLKSYGDPKNVRIIFWISY